MPVQVAVPPGARVVTGQAMPVTFVSAMLSDEIGVALPVFDTLKL